jgi:hypothetical protein
MVAGRAKRHCRRCSFTPRPARRSTGSWSYLRSFAFICGSKPGFFLAGAAPGLAASQAAKQVEPQMNANERKWRRSRSGRPVRVVIPSGRHRPLAPCPARQSHAEPATGRRADGGAGQEDPDGRGPDRTARLAVTAGRGMRFSRKDPLQRGTGRRDRDGRGPDRTARLAVVAGRGMRFSRKDPMQRGAGRRGRDSPGSGTDGAAGGCGGARNAIFAQGPYAAGSGPAGPGWSGSGPDGAAGGCGGARNAIFAQQAYAKPATGLRPAGGDGGWDGTAMGAVSGGPTPPPALVRFAAQALKGRGRRMEEWLS